MKKVFNFFLLLLLSVILFYSCSSVKDIAIQVSIPPKKQISPDIQSIAILNRSITSGFTNLQNYSLETKSGDFQFFNDSLAADTAIKVAANAIFNSQRFDVVVPLDHNIYRNDFGLLPPLDSSAINEICKVFNVNGVLVLEHFNEKLEKHGYIDDEANRGGTINLIIMMTWRLYQPGYKFPVFDFQHQNAITWTCQSDYYIRTMSDRLPTAKEALISGGIAAGQDIADQICPVWLDEKRYYFSTGKRMIDAAISLLKKNKWAEAADIWAKHSSESDISLRSKVEYNLALAAEMTGNFDQAIEWGNKSLKTKYCKRTNLYLENLVHRQSLLKAAE